MFESDEFEVPMTRVSDALRATGEEQCCSDHVDDDGQELDERKLIELNNLVQQIKLTTTPVDVTNLEIHSSEGVIYTQYRDTMEVDGQNIHAKLTIKENIVKTEIKTANTEKEALVHKLKEVLNFLENVNVQNEESLKMANLNAPLDDLLSSLKYYPVEDGRCFNDLPSKLKADILSNRYLCGQCAYVAAGVCNEWKEIIEKRLKEKGYIWIGKENEIYPKDDDICFTPSAEDLLKAAIIHKMEIKLRIGHDVTYIDSKLLAEGLTTISNFSIDNASMCFACNDYLVPVTLPKNKLEHLFNAMEKKTEIDRVCLRGLSTAHLDQGKVIDCLFKIKELCLAEAESNCDECGHRKLHQECTPDEVRYPGGPVVDVEQFVEKLLQASSGMKLLDLNLGYFEHIPQNLSINLANAMCKIKTVSLGLYFPLQDETGAQLIKNIGSGSIMMNSISILKAMKWNYVVSVEDLEMAISNLMCLKLRGDFTVEQLKMARSLSGVEVIECRKLRCDFTVEQYKIARSLSGVERDEFSRNHKIIKGLNDYWP